MDLKSALSYAANYSHIKVVRYILDTCGNTPQDRENLDIVGILRGARIDKVMQYLISAYGKDRAIVQAITQDFSLDGIMDELEGSYVQKVCLIKAIINSRNPELLTIIAKPELLAFLTEVPPLFFGKIR